jgi:hypothetical protein
MSRPTFCVTYDIVTPESAEVGDVAESGYYSRGGWKHDNPSEWTLQEIVSEFGLNSCEDCGNWFATIDPSIDYRTGVETSYSVHPPDGITRASYARLTRILAYRLKGLTV